ncbi:MAG: hypothetical protein SGI88_10670 [Candidatus Hydrogenedentes bacterium]|nr:hypothetical protein [Candidatus Hydrogenedentota bacterium]
MQSLPFEPISKILLFLHLVAAVVALGSSIHLMLRLSRALRGAFFPQARLHAAILAASYSVTFTLGGLIYPAFRIRVRHDYLDAALPWATGLFEIKELGASLALFSAIGVWLLMRAVDFKQQEHRPYAVACIAMTSYVFIVLAFNAWSGWYLGTLKSI